MKPTVKAPRENAGQDNLVLGGIDIQTTLFPCDIALKSHTGFPKGGAWKTFDIDSIWHVFRYGFFILSTGRIGKNDTQLLKV